MPFKPGTVSRSGLTPRRLACKKQPCDLSLRAEGEAIPLFTIVEVASSPDGCLAMTASLRRPAGASP